VEHAWGSVHARARPIVLAVTLCRVRNGGLIGVDHINRGGLIGVYHIYSGGLPMSEYLSHQKLYADHCFSGSSRTENTYTA
jgi:hypothetical protein